MSSVNATHEVVDMSAPAEAGFAPDLGGSIPRARIVAARVKRAGHVKADGSVVLDKDGNAVPGICAVEIVAVSTGPTAPGIVGRAEFKIGSYNDFRPDAGGTRFVRVGDKRFSAASQFGIFVTSLNAIKAAPEGFGSDVTKLVGKVYSFAHKEAGGTLEGDQFGEKKGQKWSRIDVVVTEYGGESEVDARELEVGRRVLSGTKCKDLTVDQILAVPPREASGGTDAADASAPAASAPAASAPAGPAKSPREIVVGFIEKHKVMARGESMVFSEFVKKVLRLDPKESTKIVGYLNKPETIAPDVMISGEGTDKTVLFLEV